MIESDRLAFSEDYLSAKVDKDWETLSNPGEEGVTMTTGQYQQSAVPCLELGKFVISRIPSANGLQFTGDLPTALARQQPTRARSSSR
jgi:hypothetical protein